MKTLKLKGLDMSCFTETLENGLEIIFVPYENKKNYFISFATRFGSETTSFIPSNKQKEIKVPDGIAHFLEHKMFEQENGEDPFTFFSKTGTGSNASTSFDYTQYICYGTKNFEENLRYLLNFVKKLYYTDKNVEKEKGIIAEELKMYDDIPEFQLEMKLRENIFHVSPRRIDIGGSIKEINKITKEDLYLCYENFYSPNNMFVLVVGNFPKESALEIIKDELENEKNKGQPIIKTKKENIKIRKKSETIKSTVKVPKIGFGLKIPLQNLDYDLVMLEMYLTMITTLCYGSSSEFRERTRNNKLLNSLYTEWEMLDDFRVFYIMASTNYPEKLLEEIKNELKDLVISEEAFTRMKKVWIANEVKMIDDIDATVNNIFDDLIKYKKVIPNKIELIKKMNIEKLNELIKKIDFENYSIVTMYGKDE